MKLGINWPEFSVFSFRLGLFYIPAEGKEEGREQVLGSCQLRKGVDDTLLRAPSRLPLEGPPLEGPPLEGPPLEGPLCWERAAW